MLAPSHADMDVSGRDGTLVHVSKMREVVECARGSDVYPSIRT